MNDFLLSAFLGVIEGITQDIALGGLRATVPKPVPVDRHAFVSLDLGGPDPVEHHPHLLAQVQPAHRSG